MVISSTLSELPFTVSLKYRVSSFLSMSRSKSSRTGLVVSAVKAVVTSALVELTTLITLPNTSDTSVVEMLTNVEF